MAKNYRGDTLPVTVSYDEYKFKPGDVVTAGILQLNESTGEYEVLKEVSITVPEEADEVQLEFSREDMHNVSGDLIVEVRTISNNSLEMTIQKKITLRKDGLR